MSPVELTLLLFGSLLLVLALGLPLSFVLGGLTVIFSYFLWGPESLTNIAYKTYSYMNNFILIAIPMFIFMGAMLQKSGIAESMYNLMYHWMGRIKGGLAAGTVGICTLFAAMVGISGASTVTMGLVALPSMLKRNYDKNIAIGSIAAGGALGILIPPSVTMIILGLFAGLSIGKLFIGGIFPGLLLAALFIIYILVRARFQPHLGPVIPVEERGNLRENLLMTRSLILPILLVIGVMGSIFTGAATPTEAAAVGAFGSIICAAFNRHLNWKNFFDSCITTLKLSCMIMWIVFGAAAFTSLYAAVNATDLISDVLLSMPGGAWGALIATQFIFFVLGMFLDPGAIVMLCTPIFFPLIKELGFDPLWFGVLFVVNMEMSYLTPPFGFNLFYMKAVVPEGVTMSDIYRSIIFFVLLQAVGLGLIMAFPQIVLWLPNTLIK